MPSHHSDVSLTPGEAWGVFGMLLDAEGRPLDLTAADLSWTLRDLDGAVMPVNGVVAVVDARSGIVSITVDATATATLEPGYYLDTLRCRVAGTSSLWVGGISVSANPFLPSRL